VLSPGNTQQELAEKLHDYFAAGTRLVWYVDPDQQHVEVFTSESEKRVVTTTDLLDGGNVLPGFTLSLADLFAELPRE
jgi:Uma2 family endonuclease